MKKLTIILCVILAFCGCRTIKYVPERVVETKTEIKEVIRDTTVYIPSDKATTKALLQCDSLGNVYISEIETLQGKLNAKSNIQIKDNVIIADCLCDSMSIYLQLKDRYEIKSTTETKVQYVEKELNGLQKFLIWTGVLSLLLLIIIVLFKLLKR